MCFFLVMSAMTLARMRSRWSGGKGRRVSGTAADDPDGALEFDPVGVDAGFGGGAADEGGYGVVGEQVAVDFLADHVRAPGPQHLPGAAQVPAAATASSTASRGTNAASTPRETQSVSRPPAPTTPLSAIRRDHVGHQPEHPAATHPNQDQLRLSGIASGPTATDSQK